MVKEKPTEEFDISTSQVITPLEKEEQPLTSVYSQNELTEEEKVSSDELGLAFNSFLKDKYDLQEGIAIKTTIPSGIDLLDVLMGGGFATALVQIVGMPGSGKTALASKIIATGQRKYPGKFIGVFVDTEEAMTTERLTQLGVSRPKLKPYTNLTVEKIFKLIEGLCTFKDSNPELQDVPAAIVWDSIANTLTERGMISEDINSVLGEKARVLSHLLPMYIQKLNAYRISLVSVNQLRDKIDMSRFQSAPDLKFLSDKNLPGGKSILFNSVQLLLLKQGKNIQGEYGFNGFIVQGKFVKNKLFQPNIQFPLVFSFERGFSNFWTNYELLKEYKRIKAGAWCSLISCPNIKFRQFQAIEKYRQEDEFRTAWDSEVKDVLKTEFIDKYKVNEEDDGIF